VTVEGLPHLRGRDGHGLLLLTAHFGNWELLGLAHALCGRPLAVVVRPLDSARLNRLAERLRTRTGTELIAKRGALRPVLDARRLNFPSMGGVDRPGMPRSSRKPRISPASKT